MKKRGFAAALAFLLFASIFVGILQIQIASAQGIEVSSVLVKGTLRGEEVARKTLNLKSQESGTFKLNVESVPGINLGEKEFELKAGASRIIDVVFNSAGLEQGVYIGAINVEGPTDSLQIPLIFEVESKEVLLDANVDIPPVYTEIAPGAKMVYQLRAFDLTSGGGLQEGLGAVNADVEYSVFALDGNVLVTRSEQIVVDRQSQVTNTISFPEDIAPGNYILSAAVKYQNSTGISSQIFEIKEPSAPATGKTEGLDYVILIASAVGVAVFLAVIFLFVYLLRERDKVLRELKSYNAREIKEVKKLLEAQGQKIREKGIRRSDFKKQAKEKITKLKKRQQKRISEMEKLRSAGNVKQMEKKLKEWKHQGYNISPTEYKVRELSKTDMEKILTDWKKKYSKKIQKEQPKSIKRKKNSYSKKKKR